MKEWLKIKLKISNLLLNGATDFTNSVTAFSKSAINLRNSSSFTSALNNAVASYEAYKDTTSKYNNMTNNSNVTTTKGSQILADDAPLATGETQNFSTTPATEQTQNVTFKTTTVEYPSTEKTEKAEPTTTSSEVEKEEKTSDAKDFSTTSETEQPQNINFKTTTVEYPDTEKTENVSSEKTNEVVMSDIETRVKGLVAQSKFKNLTHVGYSNYAHYIVQLQEKIKLAKNNGDNEVAERLTIRLDKEINKLTNIMDKKQSTVGKQIVSNASKALDLELAINSFIQHNTPDKFDNVQKENYYTILGKLMDAYNNLKLQNKDLAEQAHTDISNPEYNLEEATNFTKTTQASNATKEVVTEPTTSSNTSKATTQQTTTFKITEQVPTQEATAFNTSTAQVSTQEATTSKTATEQVSTQEATAFKTTTVDSHSVAPGTVDVSKLYTTDVSVGQMGIYDNEEKTTTETHSVGSVNYEKVAEGPAQMGAWDDIEILADEELAKQEKQQTESTTKSKDDDDDYER